MADFWRDFWIRETRMGQQVAQLRDRYMMMMIYYYLFTYLLFIYYYLFTYLLFIYYYLFILFIICYYLFVLVIYYLFHPVAEEKNILR